MLHSDKISRDVYFNLCYCDKGGYSLYKTKKANTKAFAKYYTLKNDVKTTDFPDININ